MSTCSNCQSRNTTCVRESSNHTCDFCRKAKHRCSLVQHPSDRSRRCTRANSPDSHGRPRPPKRPRTTTRGNSLDDFVVPDSASVSVASPTPSSRPPSPPPQPPQSSPESPAGSDRMTPRPHKFDFSSRHEYRAALRNWASRHHVTQPLYDERLRRPASSPRRGSPLRGSPRHSPLHRSPRRISDSPAPPSAPAADLQVVPRRPTPERVLSPPPARSPVPANTTIDIKPIVISLGPPSPMSRSPVTRSPAVSPIRVDPEPEGLHPTPPPSVGAAPERTTPNSSPPPLLNVFRTPRPAERGPSKVLEVIRSRAITPRGVDKRTPICTPAADWRVCLHAIAEWRAGRHATRLQGVYPAGWRACLHAQYGEAEVTPPGGTPPGEPVYTPARRKESLPTSWPYMIQLVGRGSFRRAGSPAFKPARRELVGEVTIGPNCIIHPSCTIVALGPIIFESGCIVEEQSVICNRRKTVMKIGSNNLFSVGSRVEAISIGSRNVFEAKSRVSPEVQVGSDSVIGAGMTVVSEPDLHWFENARDPNAEDEDDDERQRSRLLDTLVIRTLPDFTVIYGASSVQSTWSGEGIGQAIGLHAKHLLYLAETLPKFHRIRPSTTSSNFPPPSSSSKN
ncbi:hypothetical protein PGTUg99_019720 [Puccinia graminis f. sp. tritici]|uniref:Dynactin subunit 6 n=1 Tax=Puccinia graminis f. sp. tritici TaxID=56615 RepID=A0A5B0RUP3_PUCGR|nr:hypothetical protein PGTUg99_019720 [Puccinia graminis f. sp. tritici]